MGRAGSFGGESGPGAADELWRERGEQDVEGVEAEADDAGREGEGVIIC